jgi:hypothetical protein
MGGDPGRATGAGTSAQLEGPPSNSATAAPPPEAAAAAAAGAAAEELSRLEEVLRRPDYVLEPGCLPTIIEYIKAQGQPQTVVEMLSDGFVGA